MLHGIEMPFPLIISCFYKSTERTKKYSGKVVSLWWTQLSSELLQFEHVTCLLKISFSFNENVRLKGICFDNCINDRLLAILNQTEPSEVSCNNHRYVNVWWTCLYKHTSYS